MSYPILFDKRATQFFNLGLGVLKDATRCIVTEERNGVFELEMLYPIDGAQAELLEVDYIIKADAGHASFSKDQLFRIERIDKSMDGMINVHAKHVSYLTQSLALEPNFRITNMTASQALNIWRESIIESHPFAVNSNLTERRSTHLTIQNCQNARQALGGVAGSILDVWGGEYRFDNYRIDLLSERGGRANTLISYGRNLTDLNQEENISNTFTSIYPYAIFRDDDREEIITIPGFLVDAEGAGAFAHRRVLPVDFSREFDHDERPTVARLRELAEMYVAQHEIGVPRVSIALSFVDLTKSLGEASLTYEQVNLCDTVPVYFEKLGIRTHAKVVRVEWDVLLDQYETLEIGESRGTLGDTIRNIQREVNEVSNNSNTALTAANGKNTVFFGPDEPTPSRVGDLWYRPNGEHIELWMWNGSAWEFVMSTAPDEAFLAKINEAMRKVQEELDELNDVLLPSIREELDKLNEIDLDELREELDRLNDERLPLLQQKLDDMWETLNNLDLSDIREDLENLNQVELPKLWHDLDELNHALPSLQQDLQNLLTIDLPALQKEIDHINTDKLPALATELDHLNTTKLPELQRLLANLETVEIPDIRAYLKRLEKELQDIDQKAEAARTIGEAARVAGEQALLVGQEAKEAGEQARQTGVAAKEIANQAREAGAVALTTGQEAVRLAREVEEKTEQAQRSAQQGIDDANVAMMTAENARNTAQIAFDQARTNETAITSANQQIVNVRSDAAGALARANTAWDHAQSAQQRITGLDVSVDQINSRLTLKATQTDVNQLTGSVNDLTAQVNVQAGQISQRVTETQLNNRLNDFATLDFTQSLVNQTASSITSQVSNVQSQVDNLSIGIANMIRNSTWLDGLNHWTHTSGTEAVVDGTHLGFPILTWTVTGRSGATVRAALNQVRNQNILEPHTNYTLCGWVRVNSGHTFTGVNDLFVRVNTEAQNSTLDFLRFRFENVPRDEWTYFEVTGNTGIRIGLTQITAAFGTNGSVSLSQLMLIKGNRAPRGWSPSALDMATQLSNVEQTANGLVTSVSALRGDITSQQTQITTLSNSHNVTVGRVDGAIRDISSVTQLANGLQTSVTNVQNGLTTAQTQITTLNNQHSVVVRDINDTALRASMATGRMLYEDPTFSAGLNSIEVYNNSNNSAVTVTRIVAPAGTPTMSTHVLEIRTNGVASPNFGGFVWRLQTRANAEFIYRIVANIPTGRQINWHGNATGTGRVVRWLTSQVGTGSWQEYLCHLQCGSTGTFSTAGHFSISGGTAPTTAAPLIWRVAYATAFDITDTVSFATQAQITTLSNAINLRVESGQIINQINLSTEGILIAGNRIRITGQTAIDNGVITTAHIRDLAVSNAKIADLAVNAGKIANLAVTTAKIADLGVTNAKIGNLAVNAGKIADLAVTTAKIANLGVTEAKIASLAVTTAKIADLAVTDAKIATLNAAKITTGTMHGDRITTNTLNGNRIVANTINGDRIIANTINGDRIVANTLNANRIVAGSISTDRMAVNSIDGDRIRTNTLNASRIVAGSITTDRMSVNSIDGDRIRANTLNADRIIANTLTANMITAGTMHGDRITTNTLNGNRIVANTINGDRIIANTINGDRIQANTVSANRLIVSDFTNLCDNGTFESDATNGSVPRGWRSATRATVQANPSVTGINTSNRVLRLEQATSDSAALIQDRRIQVREGDSFHLEFLYRFSGTATGGELALGFRELDAVGTLIRTQNNIRVTTRTTTWTRAVANRLIPAGVSFIEIRVAFGATTGTLVNAFIDDLVVRRRANAELIVDGSITAAKIATGAITAGMITAGTMHGDRITTNTLQGNRIVANTINGDRIIANTINGDRIIANTINGNRILANTITADRLAANTITATSAAIASLNASRITTGTLNAANVSIINMNAANITTGTLNAARIQARSITADHLAANAIQVGFNNIGNQVQIGSTGLEIRSGNVTRSRLTNSGIHIFNDTGVGVGAFTWVISSTAGSSGVNVGANNGAFSMMTAQMGQLAHQPIIRLRIDGTSGIMDLYGVRFRDQTNYNGTTWIGNQTVGVSTAASTGTGTTSFNQNRIVAMRRLSTTGYVTNTFATIRPNSYTGSAGTASNAFVMVSGDNRLANATNAGGIALLSNGDVGLIWRGRFNLFDVGSPSTGHGHYSLGRILEQRFTLTFNAATGQRNWNVPFPFGTYSTVPNVQVTAVSTSNPNNVSANVRSVNTTHVDVIVSSTTSVQIVVHVSVSGRRPN